MEKLRTLCLIIAVSIVYILQANVSPQYGRDMFIFDHLSMSSGLSSQRIYSIIEDLSGGMWFSSKNGIDRYNGILIKNYNLKTTRMYSDASGRNVRVFIANARIYAFDNKGNLFKYNKRLDKFENELSLDSIIHGEIILNDVYVDKNNNTWFAMSTGLYALTPRKRLIRIIKNRYINLKSATKLFSVLLASKRPLITELADKLRLKYPLLPTISPCPTMRLEAIRSIIPISCRRYPKSV